MHESQLTDTLIHLLSGYERRNELKELCINLRENGELAIGGRTKLISELVEGQPYEETIGCIQVIFASSANDICFDPKRNSNKIVEQLKANLTNESNGANLRNCLTNLSHERLHSVAPLLEKVTFEDKILGAE